MIKSVFEAPKTLQLAVARVDFQRDVSTIISREVVYELPGSRD
jgi:hypothetical protein